MYLALLSSPLQLMKQLVSASRELQATSQVSGFSSAEIWLTSSLFALTPHSTLEGQ
jgi:hypothetical protein